MVRAGISGPPTTSSAAMAQVAAPTNPIPNAATNSRLGDENARNASAPTASKAAAPTTRSSHRRSGTLARFIALPTSLCSSMPHSSGQDFTQTDHSFAVARADTSPVGKRRRQGRAETAAGGRKVLYWGMPDVLPDRPDTRIPGPMTGGIHEIVNDWIEMYRETALLKVAGLSAGQLCEPSAEPSTLSLIGVIRHLTEVEVYWTKEVLEGQDLDSHYSSQADPDGDFNGANPITAFADIASYEREVAECRAILRNWDDLSSLAKAQRNGKDVNLGWILTHLIEEYARHLGHMDILRERIDGQTGY